MSKKEKYTFEQWCFDNNRQDILNRWDYEKTGFNPGDITYASAKPVYFKCPNGIHESELRYVHRLTTKNDQNNFICKECMKEYPIKKDLTGMKYGELIVIGPDFYKTHNSAGNGTYWRCLCSCGRTVSVLAGPLNDGRQITCGDRRIHHSGKNNSNWKGGVTPKLLSERTSKEYNEWRDAVYSKDWYTCQCCGESSNIEKNAHHIYNYSEYDNIKYDVKNGILMCAQCHHFKNKGSFHNLYGTHNNTPEQLEEYINTKRRELGINIPFSIESYLSGNILIHADAENSKLGTWIFDKYKPSELRKSRFTLMRVKAYI
jgi:hypothetical protein